MKKIIFFVLLILLVSGLLLYQEPLLGNYLEPRLESKLSELFGMEIIIDDLRPNIISGDVTASYVEFVNQPEFLDLPHTQVKGLRFKMDFLALLDRQVIIRDVHLYEPYYFIDRIRDVGGSRTNITTYRRHMKSRKKPKDPNEPPKKKWLVDISPIYLHNGTFIFHERSKEEERKYLVTNIEGQLVNFQWPADVDRMSQSLEVEADYGVDYPARFHSKGIANFSSSQVSFDLITTFKDGDLMEYARFFNDEPIELESGRFDLHSKFTVIKRELESINDLTLYDLNVKSKERFRDKVWGAPMIATLGFIEDQKTIKLKVPVDGNLTDPEFGFHIAFRKAFNEAFRKSVQSSMKAIQSGAASLVKAPGRIAQRFGNRVKDGATQAAEHVPTIPGEPIKKTIQQSKEKIEEVITPEKAEDVVEEVVEAVEPEAEAIEAPQPKPIDDVDEELEAIIEDLSKDVAKKEAPKDLPQEVID